MPKKRKNKLLLLSHRLGWVCCWVFLACGCQKQSREQLERPPYVAVVNGEVISVDDFQMALDEMKQAGKGYFSTNEVAHRIKTDLLERLIDQALLLQEAKKKRISLDPKLVEASIYLVDKQYQAGGLDKELGSEKMKRYKRLTEISLTISRLLQQEVIDRIAISRADIENYYEQNKEKFIKPEEIRVRQIVTKTREEAENLRAQILRGASFAELAKKHSVSPEADVGGDLGYFPKGQMPKEIEDECFKLWQGARASKVVESPYGFHLFKLVDKRPSRKLDQEAARPEIETMLLHARSREAEPEFIRALREKASIERDLQRLERVQ
jgi:peptidyl-prolyl cis-trans isomerase C/foldase protein PrsA